MHCSVKTLEYSNVMMIIYQASFTYHCLQKSMMKFSNETFRCTNRKYLEYITSQANLFYNLLLEINKKVHKSPSTIHTPMHVDTKKNASFHNKLENIQKTFAQVPSLYRKETKQPIQQHKHMKQLAFHVSEHSKIRQKLTIWFVW